MTQKIQPSGTERIPRVDVASVAGTVDLTASVPFIDDIQITGALAITKFTVAAGRVLRVRAGGGFTLTNNANIVTQAGANIVAAAGDTFMLRATAADTVEVLEYSPAIAKGNMPSVTAVPTSNALVLTLKPLTLDFRNVTGGSGVPAPVTSLVDLSTTISSGSTGGMSSGVIGDLYVAAINANGVMEIAWKFGDPSDETDLISTTAEGGAGAADIANAWYSTTARASVAHRVVARISIVQATAGTWVTSPSVIATAGGRALAVTPPRSMVRVNTHNGYGSTNTVIPRFTNVTSSVGNDIVYADSATNGASFTIQTAGVYAISWSAGPNGAFSYAGASRNSTQLTTALSGVNSTDRLFFNQNDVATSLRNGGGSYILAAGDVIRPHHDAAGISLSEFTITRVA
jgi:hypothetical protein